MWQRRMHHALHRSWYYLLVRLAKRVSRSRKLYEFSRFTMDVDSGEAITIHSDRIPTDGAHDDMVPHPLDQPSAKRMRVEECQR